MSSSRYLSVLKLRNGLLVTRRGSPSAGPFQCGSSTAPAVTRGKLHLLQFCFTSPPCLPHNVHWRKVGVGNTLHSVRNNSVVALSGGFSKRSGLAFHFGTCLSWFIRGKESQPAVILQKVLLSYDDSEKRAKLILEGLVMFSFSKSSGNCNIYGRFEPYMPWPKLPQMGFSAPHLC